MEEHSTSVVGIPTTDTCDKKQEKTPFKFAVFFTFMYMPTSDMCRRNSRN